MNRAIALVGAATISFAITTLYLQTHGALTRSRMGEPVPASVSRERESQPTREDARTNFTTLRRDFTRDATGYRDTKKVSDASIDLPARPTPADDATESERRELTDYAQGISNIAPLKPDQQRALLDSRLRHRAAFAAALNDAGFDRETLSNAERAYAHNTASKALADFKDNFLLDAQPILTEPQYEALSDFENTEFQRRLAELQTAINAK